MANRTKILVIDSDLDTLSKIYLTLVHRNYKAEASDKSSELGERLKRFRPALLIIASKEFNSFRETLKIPVLITGTEEELRHTSTGAQQIHLQKPFTTDALIEAIQMLVI